MTTCVPGSAVDPLDPHTHNTASGVCYCPSMDLSSFLLETWIDCGLDNMRNAVLKNTHLYTRTMNIMNIIGSFGTNRFADVLNCDLWKSCELLT